jgi:hypothetical protein
MTAGDLLSAAIDALARADAEELARLAEKASEAAPPRTPGEFVAAHARHRALRRLLQLTRRNLWLLRGTYRDPCGYGAPRD